MDDKKKPEKKNAGVIGKFVHILKKNKRLEILFYVAVILLILLLYLSSLLQDGGGAAIEGAAQPAAQSASAQQDVEARLSEVLSSIKGAGEVRVMITYETGLELVPAMSVDTNTNTTQSATDGGSQSSQQTVESSKPATVSGNGSVTPIVLTEKQPAVRGVIVVAQGACNIAVKLDLQRAVQTVLNVPLQNIEVFELAAQAGIETE
ncbi:MAG: hypothetical protein LBS18_06755 [Clostridiales bacterium]|jgi:stage III sporulation protein AG|nr:hypothetical protein [Clostridiales bacterium]